ncbi:hypothetical protein FQA47_008080 [Oryzias melastigma]|uniref:Uncharacterized protein n=1 Tax=Oryzias melastigma TaxID=30732 RepID=A0A834CSY9_ORYME|nr:hypothetical protein FQA47_008080 [Oryzias melastigma]
MLNEEEEEEEQCGGALLHSRIPAHRSSSFSTGSVLVLPPTEAGFWRVPEARFWFWFFTAAVLKWRQQRSIKLGLEMQSSCWCH